MDACDRDYFAEEPSTEAELGQWGLDKIEAALWDAFTCEDARVIQAHIHHLSRRMFYKQIPHPDWEYKDSPLPLSPFFFLEITPCSGVKAHCRLSKCRRNFIVGSYRIAMKPRVSRDGKNHGGCDYFHVYCLEVLVHFSCIEHINRVIPVTQSVMALRGLQNRDIQGSSYLCDGGAERLVKEWKFRVEALLNKRSGSEILPMNPSRENLLQHAGSNCYVHGKVRGINLADEVILSGPLAPYENDGLDDTQQWNLFEQYLPREEHQMLARHSLSNVLNDWRRDVENANTPQPIEMVIDLGKVLAEKARRAIRRLGCVRVFDLQGNAISEKALVSKGSQ